MRTTKTTRNAMLAAMTMGLLLLATSNNVVEGAVSDDPDYTDMTSVLLDAAGNPTVQIYYRLDLLDAADTAVNAVSMKMTHEGSAWLGLGLASSEEGNMIGAEVMIGRPDGSAQGRSGQNPSLYGPISAKSPAGLVEMAEQDFVESSIGVRGGVTTLSFTRALGDGLNGLAFDINAVQTFVWAAGPTPFPSYHSSRGDFTIDWAAVARPAIAIAATNTNINTGNALEGVMTTVTGTDIITGSNNVWTDTEGASSIDVIAGGSEAEAETGAIITDNTSTTTTGAEKETTNTDTEAEITTDITTDATTEDTSIISTDSSMQQTDANAATTDTTTDITTDTASVLSTESSMQQTDANAANANADSTTDISTDTTSIISTESSINTDTTTNADTSSYTNTNTDTEATTDITTDATTGTDTDTTTTTSVPFSDPLELEPNLTVQYRVLNVPQDGTEPAADPNAIEFMLTYVGSAWLALGTNPAGRSMSGSEIVLGQPLEPNVAAVNPAKYRVGAGYSAAAVQVMEDAQQTLLSSSIVEENGSTVLQYTKLLEEDGEHPIDPSKVNSFVYAIGMSNSYPSIHQTGESQQFSLDLSAAESQPIVGVGGGGVSGTKVFIAHGIMAVIAWAFLAPMAAAFSSLRDLFPSGPMWFKMHMTFNILATLLTVTTFLLAVIYGKASFNDKHFVTGWVIFFGVLGQATLGALRPATNPNAKDGFRGWWEQVIVGNKRAIWEATHKLLGWSLLGVAMWQMYTGLQLLTNNYGTKDYTTAYWGWIVAFWVLVGLAEIVVYVKDEKSVEYQEEKEHQVEQST